MKFCSMNLRNGVTVIIQLPKYFANIILLLFFFVITVYVSHKYANLTIIYDKVWNTLTKAEFYLLSCNARLTQDAKFTPLIYRSC